VYGEGKTGTPPAHWLFATVSFQSNSPESSWFCSSILHSGLLSRKESSGGGGLYLVTRLVSNIQATS
jgi:hypothetical protein